MTASSSSTASPITVSIVSHGHGAMIASLVRDLDRIVALRGAKILITFNILQAAAPSLAAEHLDIECIHNPQPKGFASNHNAAFSRCTTEYFLVLNPDAGLPASGFEALLEPFVRIANVGMVVPAVRNSQGGREDSLRTNITPFSIVMRRFSSREDRYLAGLHAAREGRFFWAAGMFMLFRSRTFAAIGGFDSRFHLYCEDYDVCARLWLGGWRIQIVEGYAIVHDAQRATGRSMQHLRWHLTSMLRTWLSRPFWAVSIRSLARPGVARNSLE